MKNGKLGSWLQTDIPQSSCQATLGHLVRDIQRFRANPLALIGLSIVLALILLALFAPWLTRYDPLAQDLAQRLAAPSVTHPLGTDALGRDVWSRIAYGSRISLTTVALVSLIIAPVGLLVGMVAGYGGGIVDTVLMRITDVFMAFPRLILALAVAGALGPGLINAVVAIALTSWPVYARVARTETRLIRQADFIAAIQLKGASSLRILLRHIAPLCMSSLLVRLALDMASIILTAAGLGFLGLGVPQPTAEWGAMVAAGKDTMLDQWWVAAIPGLVIFIASIGFNFLGDAVRDTLDPKMN
jgi:peptide/nickel transport system permease protein